MSASCLMIPGSSTTDGALEACHDDELLRQRGLQKALQALRMMRVWTSHCGWRCLLMAIAAPDRKVTAELARTAQRDTMLSADEGESAGAAMMARAQRAVHIYGPSCGDLFWCRM